MEDKRTKTKIALAIGKVVADLEELHDKAPEQDELIRKLTKDVSMLIYQYARCAKDWDDNSLMADTIYNHITEKF